MTNKTSISVLEAIKYLVNHNPARLAIFLDDIYCIAWNCGAYASSNKENKFLEECEINDFKKFLNQNATGSGFFLDNEVNSWKEIK